MSQKIKSSLYLAGFANAFLIYYNETYKDQTIEMASADVEHISAIEVFD